MRADAAFIQRVYIKRVCIVINAPSPHLVCESCHASVYSLLRAYGGGKAHLLQQHQDLQQKMQIVSAVLIGFVVLFVALFLLRFLPLNAVSFIDRR